jgi:hypothetical protein
LLATVAALLLVPAAQAFAAGTLTVNVEGIAGGSGEVSSVGGIAPFGGEGEPPIECSGPPSSGTCVTTMEEPEPGTHFIGLHAIAAPGSELVAWESEGDFGEPYCPYEFTEDPNDCAVLAFGENPEVTVTAYFEGTGPSGPTNRRTLTLTKAGTGQGAVGSKPKGIKCGNTCPTSVASLYKETSVVLTAKAAATAGSTLEGWEGCETTTTISATEGTCTVKMTEAKEVIAKFGGTKKAILNPVALSLAKSGNGYGAVKASGLACEADCTSTQVEYSSGDGGKKLPVTVTLTQVPAPNSSFSGWEGCGEEKEGACIVTMSEARSVTASYTLLPVETLSVTKSGTGQGAVSSKPKGIKCGNTCPSAVAGLPQNTKVVLTAKAAATAGSNLEGWEGCETTTTISATEGTCTVVLSEAKEVVAKFGGTKKAILNPVALTLTKAGSGYGTVKASGLACEPACTSTQVEYSSGDGGKKLPVTVILKAISAPGSKPVEWSGCDSIDGEGNCVVSMSSAKEVTATFDELE